MLIRISVLIADYAKRCVLCKKPKMDDTLPESFVVQQRIQKCYEQVLLAFFLLLYLNGQ